jgi:formylglycine-generating enzyme required for sulfatase activity
MVYDMTRSVAVLFGGQDASLTARADTWEWNGFGWVQRNAGPSPQARWGHGMAFDIRRARTVLFGGLNAGGALGDCWEWDGTTWFQRTSSAMPSARGLHGMAYDSARRVTVLFGGEDASGASLADAWTYDGQDWAQSSASGPAARRGAAVTFDDTRRELLVFGGADGTQVFGDTWAFDGTAWAQRATAGPSARWRAVLQHDTLCGVATLHGGTDASLATTMGDTWAWNGVAWTQAAGANATTRRSAAIAFDAQRGQCLLFGGRGASAELADTWLRSSPCSRTMAVVTPPQVGSTAVFRFDYPPSAAGHFFYHQLTAHESGTYLVPIPGFTSLGVSRVDLFSPFLQPTGWLNGVGSQIMNIAIPPDNFLAGLPVDIDVFNGAVFWGSNDAEVSIAPFIPPSASFNATPTFGTLPLVVQFTDTSTDTPTSWRWDFDNDGTVDSVQQNPTFTYMTAGLYSVRLEVGNIGGSSVMVRSNCIYAGPAVPTPLSNMVLIPAGSFLMGSNQLGGPAVPVHTVNITRPFWMAKYEVTQSQFQARMGYNPSYFQGAGHPNAASYPVERVSWDAAIAYCDALTLSESAAGRVPAGYEYRLPTEAEWEYACRAGTLTEWSTGNSLSCAQANFGACGIGSPVSVGSYPPNPWGLYDMHGNAWEWCMDWWDGSANYPATPVSDPLVRQGTVSVLRGGQWQYSADLCRSAGRFHRQNGLQYDTFGIRVVLGPMIGP